MHHRLPFSKLVRASLGDVGASCLKGKTPQVCVLAAATKTIVSRFGYEIDVVYTANLQNEIVKLALGSAGHRIGSPASGRARQVPQCPPDDIHRVIMDRHGWATLEFLSIDEIFNCSLKTFGTVKIRVD